MANGIWTNGAGTGNVQTAGNWSDAAAPADGGSQQWGTQAGSVANVTAGMDLDTFLGAGAEGLNKIVVYDYYTGLIGNSSADPLIVDVNVGTTPYVDFRGSGASQLFLKGTCTKVVVDSSSTASPCVALIGTKTCASVQVARGAVRYYTGLTATNTYVIPAVGIPGAAYLTIDSGAVPTNLYIRGGTVTSAAAPTTLLDIRAGTYTQTGPNSGTWATMNVDGGGVVYWNTPGQTITALNVWGGGVFDASRIGGIGTITTLSIFSESARVILDRRITVTNPIVSYVRQPQLASAAAQTVTWV